MNIFWNNDRYLIILVIMTILFSAAPFLFIINLAGNSWQGIVPSYMPDSSFYLIRMVKGTSLFPFGNNPYFIEHISDLNPALSIADYIASIPLKAGLSVMSALIFNSILWNIVFVILLYLLLGRLGLGGWWRFFAVLGVYFEVYGIMIRPVVMQIVLPFFTFFLLVFAGWIKSPGRLNGFWFSLGIAGTLYIYPYTWQVSFSIIGLYFLYLLWRREFSRASHLLLIIAAGLVLALPALLALFKIITSPMFNELISRPGSIKTHLPSITSFYAGRWVITGFLLWLVTAFFLPKLKEDRDFRFAFLFLMVMGWGIFFILMSPVIAGRDSEIGLHVSRELFLWLSVTTYVAVYFIAKSDIRKLNFWRRVVVALLIALNLSAIFSEYRRSVLKPFNTDPGSIKSIQVYAEPIAWLDGYDKEPAVVWAMGSVGGFVPVYSKHYGFSPASNGIQYWVDLQENKERYLTHSYFQDLTSQSIDYVSVFGQANSRLEVNIRWKMKICNRLRLEKFGCKSPEEYSRSLLELGIRKEKEIGELLKLNVYIHSNIYNLLKKYSVKYAIKDVSNDEDFKVEKLKNIREIYNDGRFMIYKFQ